MQVELVSAAIGFVAALVGAGFQHWLSEKAQRKRESARAVEHFRELGSLLIEVSGPVGNFDRPQRNSTTLIQRDRLRGELLAATAALRDAYPKQENRLATFRKDIMRELQPESAEKLRAELDAIATDLLGKR
jgi:hypothetical protein